MLIGLNLGKLRLESGITKTRYVIFFSLGYFLFCQITRGYWKTFMFEKCCNYAAVTSVGHERDLYKQCIFDTTILTWSIFHNEHQGAVTHMQTPSSGTSRHSSSTAWHGFSSHSHSKPVYSQESEKKSCLILFSFFITFFLKKMDHNKILTIITKSRVCVRFFFLCAEVVENANTF